MQYHIDTHGLDDPDLIDYAYSLVTKYGEASGTLAAEFYDEIARRSGVTVPSAEVAETPEYNEVAKAVNGTKKTGNPKNVANSVSRLVKRTGADTTLKNAKRDGAEWAWIPNGDTCVFCITLASNGWQPASKAIQQGGHAEHIHANCDCTFGIRFNGETKYAGYDPEKYKKMYDEAEGGTSREKINSMRRMKYQENKDRINAQKRAAYAERKLIEKGDNYDNIGYEKDILIPGNAGAKWKDTIIELPDGTFTRLTPHTHLEKVQIIGGKGRNRQIDKVDLLVYKHQETADSPNEWQKLKGMGYVDYQGDSYRADIHWYRHPKTGDVDHRVKPDAAGNWFYED